MNDSETYVIRFSGLKQGIHTFEFDVQDTFFSRFENSGITRGKAQVTAILEKQSVVMRLTLSCVGEVEVECDYCNQPFMLPIQGNQVFVIRAGSSQDESARDEEDIIFISPNDYELDVRHLIYEVIILAIPLHKVHPQGQCDPEMVKSIKQFSRHSGKTTDPRWDKLKNVKNKLN